jgi:long-chain acyl-CoA synthetase
VKPNASDEPLFAFTSLLAALERQGDNPAIIEDRDNDILTHSFRDVATWRLATRSRALARALLQAGTGPGERIGLMAPNGAPWIIARLAIAGAGAVAVAIDDLADIEEVAMNIRTSGLRRLFTVRMHLPMLRDLEGQLAIQPILIDEDAGDDVTAISWASLSAPHNGARLPHLAPDAPSMLVHTSGTTGSPRPFLLKNRNIEANVRAIGKMGLIGPKDRVLLPLPLHHVYPLVVGLLVPLSAGAAVVLPEAATGPKIVRALKIAGATAMIGVPRFMKRW